MQSFQIKQALESAISRGDSEEQASGNQGFKNLEHRAERACYLCCSFHAILFGSTSDTQLHRTHNWAAAESANYEVRASASHSHTEVLRAHDCTSVQPSCHSIHDRPAFVMLCGPSLSASIVIPRLAARTARHWRQELLGTLYLPTVDECV